MKIVNKTLLNFLVTASLLFSLSCSDYLDQTPDAMITDETVFSTYVGFQGFLDQCYSYIVDYCWNHTAIGNMNFSGESALTQDWGSEFISSIGDYYTLSGAKTTGSSLYISTRDGEINGSKASPGIYSSGWVGIRAANLALEKLHLLKDATDEERKLIEGQAYFFRAFFYEEMVKSYGGLPYIDKYLTPEDNLEIPRLNYQETTDRIVEDFDRAAELLPEDWDKTALGSRFQGANGGRATKGAAYALKARCLLYAGSPLMNFESTGSYEYNTEYMKRAAVAANDVFKLVDKGVYELTDFTEYYGMFGRNDGTFPWSKETIFAKINKWAGKDNQTFRNGRQMTPARFEGNAVCYTPTQNLVDEFEMINGLPISDPESNYNPMDPWSDRDPRFRGGILVDRDEWTKKDAYKNRIQFYNGGIDDLANHRSPYFCKKWWPLGVNKFDQEWNQYRIVTPNIRLAEVYMIYAEAVNEAYGPSGVADGASLTALDAINKVRERAGMPGVNAKFAVSRETLRPRIWAELSVEFFFEGHRWFNLRRWYVAHLAEYKQLYRLDFDQNYTFFNREPLLTRVFDEKHYWLPFPAKQTEIYRGFFQNPGW